MSAIAHFLESEGLQTTGISLVRENTEALRPPRFLWVSFPLGRPLGEPGDTAFQRRVILHALNLLDSASGPVLEDFQEDLPSPSADQIAACPVNFPRAVEPTGHWLARLGAELALLKPWYELAKRRRSRSTFGVAKAPVETLVARLAHCLDGPGPTLSELKPLKYALEDLKTYYQEAITAQPGRVDAAQVEAVIWRQTELGEAMLNLHRRLLNHPERRFQGFARAVAPRRQAG